MKPKQFIKDSIFRVYYHFIVRYEKYRAARMWGEGVQLAEKMYREIGSPRVYLLFDAKHMVWAPMTYEQNKLFKPSFRLLRRMGKIKGMQSIRNVEDLKRASYYYTPSKWGALGCKEDNQVRAEKLKQWMDYYMLRLSKPMRKVRDYQQSHPHLGQYRPA